jgi:hypothetical protein
MHSLHLVNYKFERRIEAVKGVRAALEQLGEATPEDSLSKARDLVNALRDTNGEPQLVGLHDDLNVVESAEELLEAHGCLAIIDLDGGGDPESYEQPQRSERDPHAREEIEPDFTVAQAQTAMACLAFAGGNPTQALAFCRTLSHTTAEDEFFDGVENALLSTFPPPKDTGQQIPVVVMR